MRHKSLAMLATPLRAVAALLTATLMVVALAACGGGSGGSDTNTLNVLTWETCLLYTSDAADD